jgi:hypothetical protein
MLTLTREVRPSRNPDPQCVHRDAPSAGLLLFIMMCWLFVGGMVGLVIGTDIGYQNAVEQGYKR